MILLNTKDQTVKPEILRNKTIKTESERVRFIFEDPKAFVKNIIAVILVDLCISYRLRQLTDKRIKDNIKYGRVFLPFKI